MTCNLAWPDWYFYLCQHRGVERHVYVMFAAWMAWLLSNILSGYMYITKFDCTCWGGVNELISKCIVALQRLQLPNVACALSAVVLTFILFQAYRLVLQGRLDKVQVLLSQNRDFRTEAFQIMTEVLRKMPVFTVREKVFCFSFL